MYKTPEEIRQDHKLTVNKFLELIGMKKRTYYDRPRIPKWTLQEMAKIGELNNGEIRLADGDVEYDIKIKRVR